MLKEGRTLGQLCAHFPNATMSQRCISCCKVLPRALVVQNTSCLVSSPPKAHLLPALFLNATTVKLSISGCNVLPGHLGLQCVARALDARNTSFFMNS